MKALTPLSLCLSLGLAAAGSQAQTVEMHRVTPEGIGESLGTVDLTDSKDGLVLTPKLHGLGGPAHGFHVHENPSCEPGMKDGKPGAALGAGGHYDPDKSGKHEGPMGHGHKGDLPLLDVAEGKAEKAVTAPRLTLADVKGHSLMIHLKGDNYSDQPEKLGGGGARQACGVIK
ncbi:MAG: superoxide dismutase family protein [Gammaproteobacteria bacterium]|nr:superoxide dismutase family protein [Gammaproteobacteria bacterium]